MSVVNKSTTVKRKPRKKFLDVDVFAKSFGPIAERAVYDVYQTTFKVEDHNMKKHSFSHCVQTLRKHRKKETQQ